MTDDGDLRARLARLDPARRPALAGRLDAITTSEIQERVMQTLETDTTGAGPATTPARWRRPALALGAAASVAAIAVAVALTTGGDTPARQPDAKETLALRTQGGGPAMSSCLPFDVAILRDMPLAFGGTVTQVGDNTVTLDVDHWFKGGDADLVTIGTGSNTPVSIDGVDFTAGTRYLVTATNGEVNTCGYSGPATPDYERHFEEAFGG